MGELVDVDGDHLSPLVGFGPGAEDALELPLHPHGDGNLGGNLGRLKAALAYTTGKKQHCLAHTTPILEEDMPYLAQVHPARG